MRILVTCLLSLITVFGHAQNTPAQPGSTGLQDQILNFQVIPPGPEASSLGSFVDVPVSLYTGKADISVPLYTLKSYQLSLPISLSYNSSGIKIEDIASFAGAGFILNAGGVVSRAIRGKADEDGYGYFSPAMDEFFNADGTINPENRVFNCSVTDGDTEPMINIIEGKYDFQPDNWFFNFAGYSGRIVFTRDKKPMLIPRQNIQIIETPFNINGATGKWVIKDEMGNTYTFSMGGDTRFAGCSVQESGGEMPNSWFLSSIRSASGLDEITLEYDMEQVTYKLVSYETDRETIEKGGDVPPSPRSSRCVSTFYVYEPKLRKIATKNGYSMVFSRDLSAERPDLQGGHRLKSIEVKFQDTFVKGYEFFHNGSAGHPSSSYLALREIKEYDASGNHAPTGYDFDYYGGSLPGRLSPNKDHWGYSNSGGNQSAVPAILNRTWDLPGANREPSFPAARTGTLKRITYPTRGYTEYEYELNSYNNVEGIERYTKIVHGAYVTGGEMPDSDDTTFTLTEDTEIMLNINMPCVDQSVVCNYTIKRNGKRYSFQEGLGNKLIAPAGIYTITVTLGGAESENGTSYVGATGYVQISYLKREDIMELPGGGLRIRRIVFNDGQSTAYSKTFDYTLPNGVTSGKILAFPNYTYYSEHDYGVFNLSSCMKTGGAHYLVRNAASNASLGTTQGSYVGYERVTVFEESNTGVREVGKSVNEFTHFQVPLSSSYPFVYDPNLDYKNGLLLKRSDYIFQDNMYSAVRILENQYTFLDPQYIQGMQVVPKVNSPCIGCLYRTEFLYNASYDETEAVLLSSSTETLFTEKGTTITRNHYKYDPVTYQRIHTFSYNSDGTLHYALNKYSHHYNAGAMTTTLSTYKATGALVEKQVWISDAGAVPEASVANSAYSPDLSRFRLAEAVYNTYNDLTLPTGQFFLRTAQPLTSSALTPSTGSYTPEDEHYEKENTINAYDSYGNILGFTDNRGYPTSFVWGYNHAYPVAEASNAMRNEIYIQNFEDDPTATESETGAHTGKRYWNAGSFTINFTPPPGSKGYLMDYWYYANGAWTAVIGSAFTPAITTPGTRLDDLRVYPEGAKVTSYTFRPGWGIEAAIDANGVIRYYKYDNFGRLSVIKDDDGNIVKQIKYNYRRTQ